MNRAIKLMILLAVAVSLPATLSAQNKPWETQKCTIEGDILSPGEVEIGINVPAWVTIVDESGSDACLHLGGFLLDRSDGREMLPSGCGYGNYFGQARMLKRQGRFDFDFGPSPCTSPLWGDTPPYWVDGDGLCPYRLVILDGVHDRKADTVTFDAFATVYLVDYTLGPPEEVESYQVGSGPVSQAGILFEFLSDPDGGEVPTEPEKGYDLCHDGADNDGDGLVDCADPNCKKSCP